MGLLVTFVSGIRRSGKSALIRVMIDQLWNGKPHYFRLVRADGDKQAPKQFSKPVDDCGVASARWIEYDSERVFEVLPEALSAVHIRDRYGSVVVEADADPILRHAYPYDHRVFVMPMPEQMSDVFRDPTHAAEELHRVLDDTTLFAEEIYGVLGNHQCDDAEPSEKRAKLSSEHMRGFGSSPLFDELATRLLLQPAYHGLVESEVIIVNPSCGEATPESKPCLDRILKLLERIRGVSDRQPQVLLCDPASAIGKLPKTALKTLKPMCGPVK